MAIHLFQKVADRSRWLLCSICEFLYTSYINHWIAAPAGVAAALVSTIGAATLMIFVSAAYANSFSNGTVILINGVIGPLLAYILYLATYYSLMYGVERRKAGQVNADGEVDWVEWRATVRYDYIAHLPSDVYLISLAAIMQCTLQFQGFTIFYALLVSQFVDDLITFLKEPIIWAGAKRISKWELNSQTTLLREIRKLIKSDRVRQEKNL